MDLTPLIYMGVGAAGSLVMWLVLGPVMTGLGVKRLARKAADGDEKSLEFFNDLGVILLRWAGSAEIKTGRKIKMQDGEDVREIDEVLTPIQMIARIIGDFMIMKLKGQAGGTKAQLGRILQEEAAEGGFPLSSTVLGSLAKGRLGPALAELAVKYGPDMLKKAKGDTSSGGESVKGW